MKNIESVVNNKKESDASWSRLSDKLDANKQLNLYTAKPKVIGLAWKKYYFK